MSTRLQVFVKAALGCAVWAALAGSAQAQTAMTPDPAGNHNGDTSWQNIGGVSYTFADTNGDHVLEVGEKVTFTVDMQKQWYGTHRYDALKVWLDDPSAHPANLYTGQFTWDYAYGNVPGNSTMPFFNAGPADIYSKMHWNHGDKYFSFDYTFSHAGTFDLLASVMCSRDLSGLVGSRDDTPADADWKAWTENIHATKWLQGQDKEYHLTVAALPPPPPPPPPVPEPETYAMMMAGLGMMGAVVRRRKARP